MTHCAFSWFLGACQPTGMSGCLENIQSEIPRFARNDSLSEVLVRAHHGRPYPTRRRQIA